MEEAVPKKAEEVLRTVFGYDSFRPGQAALIGALMAGRDVLGVMPTGAGKSLCYQVPALAVPGTALVISPLIALMDDQTETLRRRGVSAAALHSGNGGTIPHTGNGGAAAGAASPDPSWPPRFLFVAPGRLLSPSFRALLSRLTLSFVFIDEAHCAVTWGREFRPSYRRIPAFLESLPHRPPVGAFTATADPAAREAIISALSLDRPFRLVTGFDRPNLYYAVFHPEHKNAALLALLRDRPGVSGIVYCQTRYTAGALAETLCSAGFPAVPYHAGLPPSARKRNQALFMSGRIPVICATSAFGMGIDKPDIRYVIHYNMPRDMESYYQEAGRAGRDGKAAECILLYSPRDAVIGSFFLDRTKKTDSADREADRAKLRAMIRYASGRRCLRHEILMWFGETAPKGPCGACSVCRGITKAQDVRRPYFREDAVFLAKEERELYERLLALRRRTAKEAGISPEKIFPDRILRAFAISLPKTKAELLLTEGISRRAAFRYGDAFLAEIRTHLYFYYGA